MGLAGEDHLHGAVWAIDQFQEALKVVEEQVGALVGGESPGEADGETVRVEQGARGDGLHRVITTGHPAGAHPVEGVKGELAL